MREKELVLLSIPQDSIKCAGWGSVTPIPDKYVLTDEELGHITTATTTFNTILRNAAQAHDLAFADMNDYMNRISPAVITYGVANTPTFATGNIFSLDGIHLTPRGNALVANEFIRVINTKYGSSIPEVNPNNYPGVRFP